MYEHIHNKCVNVELKSIECGREECSPGHSFGPAIRQYCLIHYVEKGKGIFEINGKIHKVTAGQIFYIPPKVVTYYEADKKEPWVYRWVGIEGRNAEKFFENGGINGENSVFSVGEEVLNVMKKLLSSCKEEEKALETAGLVYEFLHLLGARPGKSNRLTNSQVYVKKATDYIHLGLHRKITVGEVSCHVNIDRSYLTALFKKELGLSPQQYIMQKKMKIAREYLSDTDYDVFRIARSLGYDDVFVFSHAFKKIVGVSPVRYRKSQ